MSKQNGVSLPFLLLLVLMSICSPAVMAFESSLEERIIKRPDPLRGLKNYRGAYNITDRHYLASAAFTGVHSYVIALLWLLCGLCFGVFVLFKKKSNNETSSFRDFMDHQHIFIFLLIIIFTILAVIAAGFVLAANESSMHRTGKFKSTIVRAGRQTHRSLYKVILATTDMQVLLRPYDPATSLKLYNITHRLARDSKSIQNFVQKTVHAIDLVIQISHTSHLVVVAIDLVLLGASLVLLLLHWHPGFLIIIFICWILTTLFWALTGVDFFLHIFVDDTCIAFHEYDQLQNSSMRSLLPCVDPAYSDKILTDIGKTVHDYVSQLKSKAVEFYGSLGLKEQNSDILGLNRICDPFSGAPDYTYTPELCPDESITIDQLSKVSRDSFFFCRKNVNLEYEFGLQRPNDSL
ncbi:hypothetical protein K2173_002602 [Erythroxylum novogranatense]|uniref:Gustatory receptor n=1 Tax=Erythroxylum novogranatense TaxID=1862640 RepID=A0AAV8TUE2_9ROSI|nr:hypothetical protein K2173_002602 [Erythroxylum novogranatense]